MGSQQITTKLESNLQNRFQQFRDCCFKTNPELQKIKRDFEKTRNCYSREHCLDEFCNQALELSDELNNSGQSKISALILNELGKLCISFNLGHRAEELLYKAIENCRQRNDGLHELARLVDLEKLYKFTNQRKELFRVLNQKKECCKRVLNNYDEIAENFESLYSRPTTKKDVYKQLAYTYASLANLVEYRRPYDAINLYRKEIEIYQMLGESDKIEYLLEKIRRVQQKI